MVRVRSLRTYPLAFPDLEVVGINNVLELVPADMLNEALLLFVQVPELHSTNPRINRPDFHDKLQGIGN